MMNRRVVISAAVAALLFSGCAEKQKNAQKPSQPESQNVSVAKPITLSVADLPVRKLMQSVCMAESLSCDFSSQPSDKYKVTFNYSGDLDGMLSAVKRQTGLKYVIADGMVVLDNKDDVTLYEDPLKKPKCGSPITISFKNMTLTEAFKYFHDTFGYSFTFDFRHTSITPPQQPARTSTAAPMMNPGLTPPAALQAPMPVLATTDPKSSSPAQPIRSKTDNIAFYYTGCDPREALESFLSTLDMTMKETKDKEFKIQDYDVEIVDKSVYFNYSMTSGSAVGGSGSSGNASGTAGGTSVTATTGPSSSAGNSTGATSNSTVSVNENHRQQLEELLRHYMSKEYGKLDFSMRGYVVIEDKPSYIKRIKSIIKKEIEKEAPLSISINIVRVDLNDNYKAGVDWNAVWSKGLFGLRDLRVQSSMSGLVNGGFSVTGAFKGTEQVLTMLQDYGNTKIERSNTIRARSGFLANYEATKPIPYVTTSSTVTGSSDISQMAVTPLYEQEGFTLNILPNVNLDAKTVDLGIDVTVAEYAGDKVFDLGSQGTFTIPIVPKDKGKFAVQAKLGETVILTGFKVKKGATGKQGIPGLSQVPVAGALFGYQESLDEMSEILIILKVEQVRG